MNILVVAGSCLQVNSSANLCHISYINGLISAGHTVDLVTVNTKNQNIDTGIMIPKVRQIFSASGSMYEQLAAKRSANSSGTINTTIQQGCVENTFKMYLVRKAKNCIRACYGVYNKDIVWYWKIILKYKFKTEYDYVISLSYPPVSHKTVDKLLKSKRLIAKKWIQIWEDPWYADLFGDNPTEKIKNEEKKLLDRAEEIYYVSPLTLYYQKEYFGENSEKMKWQPLPTYYESKSLTNDDVKELCFGYFGDYAESIRNLRPFYEVAKKHKLKAYICGNSNRPYETIDNIYAYPRMSLEKLKIYEDKANVLVFVSNIKGGQIPGKIYQYSATNKYILFILDGTEKEKQILKEYFSQYKRYVFCENNEKSIYEAIQSIRQNCYEKTFYSPLYDFEPRKIIEKILNGE